jgi:hypothetical protein
VVPTVLDRARQVYVCCGKAEVVGARLKRRFLPNRTVGSCAP